MRLKKGQTVDAYDRAIQSLINVPDDEFTKVVNRVWMNYDDTPEGVLFGGATPSRSVGTGEGACLTMIRNNYEAYTPELTLAIRNDERIPNDVDDITKENLYVFAEWQRRLDKELNRTPPEWMESQSPIG